jgi:deoxyhypusine synthase
MASTAHDAVLVKSTNLGDDAVPITGPTSTTTDAQVLVDALSSIGFQASNFGKAVSIAKLMLQHRNSRSPSSDGTSCGGGGETIPPATDTAIAATLYLGVTSNLFGTGVRDSVAFLAQHRLIDVIVVTGGGPEHDVRRTLSPGSYRVSSYGATEFVGTAAVAEPHMTLSSSTTTTSAGSKEKQFGRFGNVTYEKFPAAYRNGLKTILKDIIREKLAQKRAAESEPRPKDRYDDVCRWTTTPSEIWRQVGLRLPELLPSEKALKSSVLYWAARNDIPIFSPSFTDGDVMDLLEELEEEEEEQRKTVAATPTGVEGPAETFRLHLDLVHDIHLLNKQAMQAQKTGMIILGGGVAKHHVCNANLMRNGADLSIFVNNAQEFDGSDAGARPDEAVSWGEDSDGWAVRESVRGNLDGVPAARAASICPVCEVTDGKGIITKSG